MRISRKLVNKLALGIGLAIAGVPVPARAVPIIGSVNEGSTATFKGAFFILNPNAFAVTLTSMDSAVTGNSDPSDFLMSATIVSGSCVDLLGKAGAFAANAICAVDLAVLPSADVPESEPIDFGLSEVTLTYRLNSDPLMTQVVAVQVNDTPEPATWTMIGLGVLVLLGTSGLRRGVRCFLDCSSEMG
jgi:hypothetical protein